MDLIRSRGTLLVMLVMDWPNSMSAYVVTFMNYLFEKIAG